MAASTSGERANFFLPKRAKPSLKNCYLVTKTRSAKMIRTTTWFEGIVLVVLKVVAEFLNSSGKA